MPIGGHDFQDGPSADERYRALFDHSRDAIYLHDFEGRFLDANAAALELLGYTRDEIRSLHVRDLLTSEADVERAIGMIRELLATGSQRALSEYPLRSRAGDIVWVEVLGSLVLKDGQPWAVQGVARDITARRRAELDLRLQGAALQAAANAMVITDREGTIEWVNPAFTRSTGYAADEAVGRRPGELLRSGVHDQAFYRRMWDTILAGDVWQGEVTNRRKDGSLVPEEMTITPVKDAAGRPAHFIAIKRDLTEVKRLQAEVLQAQKLETVGRLAGGIAHDFNNLLTIINATADLAAEAPATPDQLRRDLRQIREAGTRAAELTRQLLAFSRKQILQPVVMNLGQHIVGLRRMLQRLIGEDVELMVAPPADQGIVRADPGQIEQVVLNLVVNARDAMPDGGKLTIETRDVELDDSYAAAHGMAVPGPRVMLAVTDTGAGMDEATRARIFEPFFTTKGPGKGTGLGLSIVYGIVNQSGGSIGVYSEPGQGTSFKIFLPRVDAEPRPTPAATPGVTGGHETILLVEDEAAVRRLGERILRGAGYTVLTAGDGPAALDLLAGDGVHVELLITDVVLPGMNGRALADRVGELHPEVKVLFTSGYTDDAILRHGVLDRGVAFLGKPYTAPALTSKVRELLDG